VGDGCTIEEEMDAKNLTLLVKDHEEIHYTLPYEHWNCILR
jgi:hypothetical protein